MNKQAANHRIGERLHQVREHRNISQARLARAVEVSVGTIQNYEHGRAHITIDRLEQLARALQCEPADLLTSPETPPPRYHRPRYGYRQLTTLASLAILAVSGFDPTPGGSPQFALDLEEFADHLERIKPDDFA
jgi:transcriptional regulator with XRE-family HTH domain